MSAEAAGELRAPRSLLATSWRALIGWVILDAFVLGSASLAFVQDPSWWRVLAVIGFLPLALQTISTMVALRRHPEWVGRPFEVATEEERQGRLAVGMLLVVVFGVAGGLLLALRPDDPGAGIFALAVAGLALVLTLIKRRAVTATRRRVK